MNENLLHREVQDFINHNLNTDVHAILLGKKEFPDVDNKEIVEQIESKRKAEKKLPTWFATDNIYYANKLNISQTSSEVTGHYKANLVSGNSLLDLTGGFGIDTYCFSKKIKQVFHIEANEGLSKIAEHNFKQLDVNNVICIAEDGIEYLKTYHGKIDWIYLDPSRRDKDNKKVYFLKDCEPDVTQWLELFFSKADNILIKTGPLLDISLGIQQLQNVSTVHVLSVDNEVKEILWELKKGYLKEPLIKTINIEKGENQIFQFHVSQEKETLVEYSEPLSFLYEPNAAIMKSGAFNLVGKSHGLIKLQEHSHLYTSNELVPFPGRVFKIDRTIPYSKKNIKQLGMKKANVTTRNFPESVIEIRKKTKLKEGGHNFLFFTKNHHNDLIIISAIKTAQL